jgi:hypothetical protein
MHKVGSIRKASDGILRSVMNLVLDVATDGELLKISTKAIERIKMPKRGGELGFSKN